MKTQLKDGIWIEGFDLSDLSEYFLAGVNYTQSNDKEVLFVGKTSEISEELAKTILPLHPYSTKDYPCYFEYDNPEIELSNIGTQCSFNKRKSRNDYLWKPKESIKSACSQEYCIIYKTK